MTQPNHNPGKDHDRSNVMALPDSLQACQALIGALVLDSSHVDDVMCMISADDFFRNDLADMYRAITALHERGDKVDILTVIDEFERTSTRNDADTVASIIAFCNDVITSSNAVAYAKIIARDAAIRRTVDAATKIQQQALHGDAATAMEVVDSAEAELLAIPIRRAGSDAKSVRDSAADYIQVLSQRTSKGGLMGVTTGITLLDAATDGLEPGLIIVAGRPSTGKTALATSIMHAAGRAGTATLMLSMEMSTDQMWHRLLGCQGVTIDIAKHPQQQEHWEQVNLGVRAIRELPLHIDASSSHSIASARRAIRRAVRRHGIRLAVIDYLQLMDASAGGENDNRNEQLSGITRQLKILSGELQIPIVLLSQLNRKIDERKGHRPMLSDLRDSGAIEQDADLIIFTHCDWVYNKSAPADKSLLIVGKNRNGAVCDVMARFDRPCARFTDPDDMTLMRWRTGGNDHGGSDGEDYIEWGSQS